MYKLHSFTALILNTQLDGLDNSSLRRLRFGYNRTVVYWNMMGFLKSNSRTVTPVSIPVPELHNAYSHSHGKWEFAFSMQASSVSMVNQHSIES